MIVEQSNFLIKNKNNTVYIDEDLLEEVCAIVEYPCAVIGGFNNDFLHVPREALITSMQEHQKCFPILDSKGSLHNQFIAIANIKSKNEDIVIKGNEKVIAARLSDSAFFFDLDTKQALDAYIPKLNSILFEKSLGTLGEKSTRIAKLSQYIAKILRINEEKAYRAGLLAKADLMTSMVYEFTHLQGIMGKYYAKISGETDEICQALEEHYWPLNANSALPSSLFSACIAIADKMDTLVGIFSTAKVPTSEKDPFALRRAAIGVIKILKYYQIDISIKELIDTASKFYSSVSITKATKQSVHSFLITRLVNLYKEIHIDTSYVKAVTSIEDQHIADIDKRLQALVRFSKEANADKLIQLHKRIYNILVKK